MTIKCEKCFILFEDIKNYDLHQYSNCNEQLFECKHEKCNAILQHTLILELMYTGIIPQKKVPIY